MLKVLRNLFYKFHYQPFLRKNRSIRFKHKWIEPSGFDTGIKIYSRIKDENVPLILLNKEFVKWYICGPTVYDVSHIGHASCYIRFDIIRRVLEHYFDVKPVVALGITDVDDKIIKRSKELNIDFKTLAKKYELEFFKCLSDLNVLPPTITLRVSDHIPEIINFVKKIVDKSDAYVTENGSVYFDTRKFKNYGKLCLIPEQGNSDLQEGQKFYQDFALWKASKSMEPYWESPWGKGRPGWHIECSAMTSKVFGSNVDIHSGGIDLVFPHHENEEAQSCSYYGCDQWVNYWCHAGELMVTEQKMSKSLNNFISINDYLKDHSSDEFRMFCFISHYRKGLHYCESSLDLVSEACVRVSRFLADSNSYINGNWSKGYILEGPLLKSLHTTSQNVRKNLTEDFNTAACFLDLMQLIKTAGRMLNDECTPDTCSRSPGAIAAVSHYIENTFKSFGFKLKSSRESDQMYSNELDFIINSAMNFRKEVRNEALSCSDKSLKKNLLTACDNFRSNLGTVGITIKDQSNEESSWGRI